MKHSHVMFPVRYYTILLPDRAATGTIKSQYQLALKRLALFLLKKRISSFEEDRPPRKPLRLKSPIPIWSTFTILHRHCAGSVGCCFDFFLLALIQPLDRYSVCIIRELFPLYESILFHSNFFLKLPKKIPITICID
jgi:hypothetical protein